MVFESLVADVLNRFLGDYVQNLDHSQLKIGIWGGDVVLTNLELKENALAEFDLPIRTVAGRLGKLILKIPWKSLYTSPVIAIIEGLDLLAVPNTGSKYDREKEEKAAKEAKIKQLQRIEEAKLREAEKAKTDPAQDTFTEKLVSQIIKNLQVRVMDIHVRYEDSFTNPSHPFSCGLTLHNLSFESTDDKFQIVTSGAPETQRFIFKLIALDSFSFYWNSDEKLYSHLSPAELHEKFQSDIASSEYRPSTVNYVLGPINSTAHLQMNPKPELDGSNYQIPKIALTIDMEEIALSLRKCQYQDIMQLLQALERISAASLNRKYHPGVPIKGNSKSWWKFAYTCTVENGIRRQKKNWSWHHISEHRSSCRIYKELYREKLMTKKLSDDVKKKIEHMEDVLDVFNITLARKQAEVEYARLGSKAKPDDSYTGWISSWMPWNKEKKNNDDGSLVKKFEEAMNSDEKSKLYDAIGYQENAAPTEYPKMFVENQLNFRLHKLTVTVNGESLSSPDILKFCLEEVTSDIQMRPSAQAIKIEARVGGMRAFGLKDLESNNSPAVVQSLVHADSKSNCLLDILIETNPLDNSCDQKIRVTTQPLEIVYHAQSIAHLVDVFRPPEDVSLEGLQEAAKSTLQDFNEKSAAGLQHAISTQKILDLNINIQPSYVIIPENGSLSSQCHLLIVDLGSLNIHSISRDPEAANLYKLTREGSTESERLIAMREQSYDKFVIALTDVQILLACPGDDWKAARHQDTSLHLLKPTNLSLEIQKCVITDDPNLPKMKIKGRLPSFHLVLSDTKLLQLATVALSAAPKDIAEHELVERNDILVQKSVSTVTSNTNAAKHLATSNLPIEETPSAETPVAQQVTNLELNFEIEKVGLTLIQKLDNNDVELFAFALLNLGVEMVQHPYDMKVNVYLGGLTVEAKKFTSLTNGPLYIVRTPMTEGSTEKLFSLCYLNANKKGPEFATAYRSVEQLIKVRFSKLNIVLHQDAILDAMSLANNLQAKVDEIQRRLNPDSGSQLAKIRRSSSIASSIYDIAKDATKKSARRIRKKDNMDNIINIQLDATMDSFSLAVCTALKPITDLTIKGLDAGITIQKSKTSIVAKLQTIAIYDPSADAMYKQILSFVEGNAFDAEVIIFNDATKGAKYEDLSAVDTSLKVSVGGIQLVFLNKFVSEVMGFVNQFQVAKEKVIKASAAAAEAAKQNMQNMYQKAPRVQLQFKMKAPIIIIPQNSRSGSVLVADLGLLFLVNKFSSGSSHHVANRKPIFDIIKIELQNLKLTRAIIDPSSSVVMHKCLLLEPLSFNIDLVRNLTINWHKEDPEIDVKGKLAAVNLVMTQEDFATVMAVMNENLSEGNVASTSVESKVKISKEVTCGPLDVLVEADESQEIESVFKRVKFNFHMESFTIKLYSGSSLLEEDMPSKRIANPLAKFELKMLAIKGEMSSDNSLWSNIVLVNCVLDDTRVTRHGGITRLMDMVNGGNKSMLDVTYRQEASGDKFLDLKVYSFMLVLCVDYMKSVGTFFTEGLTPASNAVAKSAVSPTKGKAERKGPPEPQQAPTSKTVIKLRLEQPDIIIVEDIDNIDSPGIIFNNEVNATVQITPETQNIMAQVSKLQLITCCYNPSKRASSMAEILSPCEICITSATPFGEGMHLDVNVSDVVIHVTPSTIRLLSSISASFGSKPALVEGEQLLESKDYSNIWQVQSLKDSEFWFMKTEEAVDALESMYVEECACEVQEIPARGEQMLLELKTIILTLETGSGSRTIPMVLMEASFSAEVRDWSNKLYVGCSFNMEVAYYNEKLAVYEPLIEPVDVMKESRPWELIVELRKNESEMPPVLTDDDTEEIVFAPAAITLNIISQDVLEVVVTKTALEVISNLAKAFGEAISTNIPHRKELPASPYTLKNESGLSITLILKDQEFEVFNNQSEHISEVVLEADTLVPLSLKDQPSRPKAMSILKEQNIKEEHSLLIKINTMDVVRPLSVTRADKHFFPLPHRTYPGDQWGLVTEVISEYGFKTILLRSSVQINNHFSVPVEAYYMTEGGNEVKFCGQVEPHGRLNLPLHAVYSKTNEIFLRPKYNGYTVSIVPFVWKDLQKNPNLRKVLQCNPRENDGPSFFMNVIGEIEQVFYENTNKKTIASTCYNIHLHPTAVLCNQLPHPVTFTLKGVSEEFKLEEGHSKELFTAELNSTVLSIKIQNYMNDDWCSAKVLTATMEEVWSFESSGTTRQILDLGVHLQCDGGFLHMSLYCPFWMLNKTGLSLGYRRTRKAERNSSHGSPAKNEDPANIITHPPTLDSPIMFSFRPKVFFSKKKASLKVENSEWSDKFSLDTVGSSGSVSCTNKAGDSYQIGVTIRLTNVGVSKIVVFTPFYLIVNNATYDVECCESLAHGEWIKLPAGQCLPFWPKHHLKKKELILRVAGTKEETKPLTYDSAHTTLLSLGNNKGGLNVDCQITEVSVVITINEYVNGMATVCLINHCTGVTLVYMQSGFKDSHTLEPQKFLLYTWEDPNGTRELTWLFNQKVKIKNTLVKDGIGEYDVGDTEKVYWVSFLNDTQRVLMFTDDLVLATNAQCAGEFEKVDQEILISLQGIGLSLVNDHFRQEIMYLALASSGIIWEFCKPNSQRYRPFNLKDCQILEAAHQKYSNELKLNKKPRKRQTLDNKLEVDFEEATLYRPVHMKIRRTFQPGLWAQYKTSLHQIQFHAKINRLQIDNQLDDCVFPTVVAPVPVPKSVAADTAPKPFTEASIILRKSEHSTVQQFKYFKVLVQEFHIKLDQSFINALIELFSQAEPSESKKIKLFEQDQKVMKMELKELATITSSQEQKNFYDILHFSPLKVHISFSMQGGGSSDDPKKLTPIHSDFLNLLLQSVGVTLTEIQDVVFRLAFFEKQHVFMTQKQLSDEAIRHYTAQAIKQMYVLILGLDVIGNPFGLVMGLGKGVEDFFYEPFQGAVQGPEEFAEGLALGIKSLFGHAVGGAAGAVSRITGTLGKGVAALTMDEDYQRKRREALNRRPANLQEGLARSGKGLVMGVYDGVTGVFVKPIEGAKQEGVEGFFKGVGKGVVGLVTRPTSGVIDFASGSLDAVKRVAELSEEVHRLRPPRYFQPDGVIKPYNKYEAEGNTLLKELEKGKFAVTDNYIAHIVVTQDGKAIFLVTDKRLIMISKGEIFGQWNCEWNYTWDELKEPPTEVQNKGLQILLKKSKKKTLGIFGSSHSAKIVEIKDPGILRWLLGKIDLAMKRTM